MPELFAVLMIALTVYVLRTGWEWLRTASGHPSGEYRWSEHIETERKRAQLMACCLLLILISIPLILRAVPPNGIYGFRTAMTQSSSTIWYQANAFMGWALAISSMISGVTLIALPTRVRRWVLWVTFLVPLAAAIVASFAYLNQLA